MERLNNLGWKVENGKLIQKSLDDKKLIKGILLKNSNGFIIGEEHGSKESKEFISDNIKTLVEANVKVIMLEHLKKEAMEELLEKYFNKSITTQEKKCFKKAIKRQPHGEILWKIVKKLGKTTLKSYVVTTIVYMFLTVPFKMN